MIRCLGLSGFPVFQAGQASWQRPHSVQVKPSSRSFQPRSWSVRSPNGGVLGLEVELGQLAARGELAEPDVREGRGDVEVLAERQVAQERRDERDVAPPEQGEPGLEDVRREAPERHREGVRDEGPGHVTVASRLEGLREQLGRDHAADHREDHERVAVEGESLGLRDEPAHERPADRDEDDDRDDVLHRRDERPEQAVERDREDGLDDARRSRCSPSRSSGGRSPRRCRRA